MTEFEENSASAPCRRDRIPELARLFLKLGLLGFGGPPAHIALINDEAVLRRHWLTPAQFAEGLAICEMLPGPASTQLGLYVGYLRAGQLGALVAGLCFIAPAWVIVVALSWGYFHFQALPQLDHLLLGISPVVTAIILGFCWRLTQKILGDFRQVAIACVVFALTAGFAVNILLQFIGAGLIGLWWFRAPGDHPRAAWIIPSLPWVATQLSSSGLPQSSVGGSERISEFWLPLTLFFLKVGSFIFGGGLVIIPLLESEVVEQLRWLTPTEFINGVAIGQLSPGPVVLTAAFVGYKVAGVLGSLVATIAIFTPSFGLMMLAAPLLVRLCQKSWVQTFLKGVTPGVLGAIAAATIPLARTALTSHGWLSAVSASLIGGMALLALMRYKMPTWQLIPLGAVLGLLIGALYLS